MPGIEPGSPVCKACVQPLLCPVVPVDSANVLPTSAMLVLSSGCFCGSVCKVGALAWAKVPFAQGTGYSVLGLHQTLCLPCTIHQQQPPVRASLPAPTRNTLLTIACASSTTGSCSARPQIPSEALAHIISLSSVILCFPPGQLPPPPLKWWPRTHQPPSVDTKPRTSRWFASCLVGSQHPW